MRNSTFCVLATTFILIVGPEAELVDLSHTLDKNANNWPIKGFKRYNHTNLTVGKYEIFALTEISFSYLRLNFDNDYQYSTLDVFFQLMRTEDSLLQRT